jgi:hypothetical protein
LRQAPWIPCETGHRRLGGGCLAFAGFADVVPRGSVQDQPERALEIMLADQDDAALEERTLQLAVIQQQLAFERFV